MSDPSSPDELPTPASGTLGNPADPVDIPGAAVLLIGDELLSGKIRDENGHFLAQTLRRRGIALRELCVVGDGIDEIGEALLRLCRRAPLIFTSGGVGPTHDDRTLEAIAQATKRPLVRHPEMERQLRRHYRGELTPQALSMADLPEGTQLRALPGWPVFRLDIQEPSPSRIYILPGVPLLLRAKIEHLERLDGELPSTGGWHLALIHTDLDESKLAPHLSTLVAEFPRIEIGSYPRWSRGETGEVTIHVRVTLEAPVAQAGDVQLAAQRLAALLPPERLLPDEPPS